MKAFISYSHKDSEHLVKLHEHLSALRRQQMIETWTDREIHAGGVIEEHVNAQLEQAELYLLLVSSAFIESRYCYDKEFARALERHGAGKALIVPIIIRECDWDIAELRQFMALPDDGKAVISRHWHTADEGFANVADGLRVLLERRRHIQGIRPSGKGRAKPEDEFTPDARHVSDEQRAELRKVGDEIVDRLTVKYARKSDPEIGRKKGMWYGIVWNQFNEQFGTQRHGLKSLPKDRFGDAKTWLLQYRASKDRNLKRSNPQKYRGTLTKTIYTLVGQLGWTKAELYAFASNLMGYARAIESLNDLGNSQLELVRDRVRYEFRKRSIKAVQSKARRKCADEKSSNGAGSHSSHLSVGGDRDDWPERTDTEWHSGTSWDSKSGALFGLCHRCGRWAVRGANCIMCGASTSPNES